MTRYDQFRYALRRFGLSVPLLFCWTIGLGVTVNALHAFSDRLILEVRGGEPGLGPLATTLATWVGLMAALVLTSQWWLRRPVWGPRSRMSAAPQKAGLIILVSRVDSALFAIQHHLTGGPLRHVWLIPSAVVSDDDAALYGGDTRATAEEIRDRARAMAAAVGRALDVSIHPTGVSPSDSLATFDHVRLIFRERHLPLTDMVVDFTGGTKPMTIGLVMASLSPDVLLEYVPFNQKTGTMHGPYFIDYRSELFDL